jgi:hypothetical protein
MHILIKIKRNALKFSHPLVVSGHIMKRERKSVTRKLEDGVWKSAEN